MANPLSLPMARGSLRNLFTRPATRRYPVETRPRFAGARGMLELDLSTCVFCGLCVRRCPAVALDCSREGQWLSVDQLRCISCGVCVDVCNKKSLTLNVAPPVVLARTEAGAAGRPGHREWRKEPGPAAAGGTATGGAAAVGGAAAGGTAADGSAATSSTATPAAARVGAATP